MAVVGISPGIIATIVVIVIIAVILIVFYFVCRSDDPARDHTCVAMLYPRTRRELQQLRIPLDPVNPVDVGVNPAYEEENNEKGEGTTQHMVQIHNGTPPQLERKGNESETNEQESTDGNTSQEQQGFVSVSLQPTQASSAE